MIPTRIHVVITESGRKPSEKDHIAARAQEAPSVKRCPGVQVRRRVRGGRITLPVHHGEAGHCTKRWRTLEVHVVPE